MQLSRLLIVSAAVTLVAVAPSWAGGFTITPTFTTALMADSNAATIESAINAAINVYQTKITNPVNINIMFDKMTTGLGESSWLYYTVPYATFYSSLVSHADPSSAYDTTALAHLSGSANNPVTGTANMYVKASNLIALGFTGINAGSNTVSLNTTITTPGSSGSSLQYSLIATAEHEIDEVLGTGSSLDFSTTNPLPNDLFRYGTAGARSYTTSASAVAYLSLDGTTKLAQFNQTGSGDFGDWQSSPRPNGVAAQVQDAFATPNINPVFGPNETALLDSIGYNFASTAAPEPSAGAVLLLGIGLVPVMIRRRA